MSTRTLDTLKEKQPNLFRKCYCNNCKRQTTSTKKSKKCLVCNEHLYKEAYVLLGDFCPARSMITPLENRNLVKTGMGWCSKCKKVWPLSAFCSSARWHYESPCVVCRKSHVAQYKLRTAVSEKTCGGCKTPKAANLFSTNPSRPDGLNSYCKECIHTMNRSSARTNSWFRLKKNIKRRIRLIFEKGRIPKKGHLNEIVGCDYDFLLNYVTKCKTIEYTKDMVIDHICPTAQAQDIDEVHRLQHYSNFRLITKDQNSDKSDKPVPEATEMCRELLGRDWI